MAGELARSMGALTPIRLVSSAKSWLCHPGVDRRAPILPPEAPDDVTRLSPLEASIRYLEHLGHAFAEKHPEVALETQPVTITVPASFDPAAREPDRGAAKRAGFENLTLLEEPQAAVYSWIQRSQGSWREQLSVGDVILVIDLGGGTTDFSLIHVTEADGALALNRVAVGDHILLGGDNMDLTLAHVVRQKLEADGARLDGWQVRALAHACRGAKETLLADPSKEEIPIVVPSRGSKLVGGSLRTSVTQAEVQTILLSGFFPKVSIDERPKFVLAARLLSLGFRTLRIRVLLDISRRSCPGKRERSRITGSER